MGLTHCYKTTVFLHLLKCNNNNNNNIVHTYPRYWPGDSILPCAQLSNTAPAGGDVALHAACYANGSTTTNILADANCLIYRKQFCLHL